MNSENSILPSWQEREGWGASISAGPPGQAEPWAGGDGQQQGVTRADRHQGEAGEGREGARDRTRKGTGKGVGLEMGQVSQERGEKG